MKRHNAKKTVDGVSRAQMVIRRGLGWMSGFPDGRGNWIAFPAGESVAIGRTELRRATYSIGKLHREFPRALPKIVGDVDRWAAMHRSLLEALKPSVHGSETLPDCALDVHSEYQGAIGANARRAMLESPSLRKAISAFGWYFWNAPERFRPAIKWLQKNRDDVGYIFGNLGDADACILLVRLLKLQDAHGHKSVAPLLTWFAKPLLCTTPIEHGARYAEEAHIALNWKEPKPTPARPTSTLAAESRVWVEWVAQQNPKAAKRALSLFGVLHETVATQGWEAWWQSIERLIRTAKALPSPTRRRKGSAIELERLRAKILDMGRTPPPVVSAQKLFALLRDETSNPNEAQRRAIQRGLEALPTFLGEVPMRLAFLFHWNLLRRSAGPKKQNKLTAIIQAFGDFVRQHDDLKSGIRPWKVAWDDYGKWNRFQYARYTLDTELLDELPRTKQVYEYFVALRILQASPLFDDSSADDAETLVEVLLATNDAERAVVALTGLKEAGLTEKYLPTSTLILAGKICGSEVRDFAPVVRSLVKAGDRVSDIKNLGTSLLLAWEKLPGHLRLALLQGHLPALCGIVLKGEILRHTGESMPRPRVKLVPARTPSWICRYPTELRASLLDLFAADEDAEATASRILSRDFPSSEKLQLQIAELEERLTGNANDEKLVARICKLRGWLANPKTPGAGRMANLAEKLRQSAIRSLVDDWSLRVEHAYLSALPRLLEVDVLPEWATDSGVLELLLPVGGLEKGFQRLVAQILKARSGEPPWDMRGVAGNQRFLRSLAKQGVATEPWLDDAPIIFRDVAGETIRFTLERDPLEVFAMGGHFKTCLSPGSFNYFSVFANAADVNKQVLYGRRSDGTVVARCLLALTMQGGIVVFHAYRHDKALDFGEVLREYVKKLAGTMNTVVLAKGRVPTLIAPDWYDDGVVDVTEQFVFLGEKKFLKELESIPLEDFLTLLTTLLAPLGLDEQTLPMILWLDVFRRRPELVLPLYSSCLHNERVSPGDVLRVAQLLERCQKPHEAERLAPRLVDHAQAAHRQHQSYTFEEVLTVLAWCSPMRALSLLKKTRGKGNRNWNQETDGGRIHAAARANLRLHRRRQAERLLQRGVAEPCCGTHKEMCANLLTEMSHLG